MSFDNDVEKFIKKANGNLETILKQSCLEISNDIILNSPVDSGQFRANWYPRLDKFSENKTDDTDKSGQVSIDRTISVVSGLKTDSTFTLVNNLPYAMRLEFGWSTQNKGFVRSAVKKWDTIIKKAVLNA